MPQPVPPSTHDSKYRAAYAVNGVRPGAFFGRMTERRWALVRALQGQGETSLRELARRVERDVKRVHEDVQELLELGLVGPCTC